MYSHGACPYTAICTSDSSKSTILVLSKTPEASNRLYRRLSEEALNGCEGRWNISARYPDMRNLCLYNEHQHIKVD
jgi:hypothetical protein